MSNRVYKGEELQTALKVDGVTYSPILVLLKGQEISKEDIDKLLTTYGVIQKDHPRRKEILIHISSVLQCLAEEPLSPLGRSLQFEDKGVDLHAMQIPVYSMDCSTFGGALKKFFKSITVKDFRTSIGKGK